MRRLLMFGLIGFAAQLIDGARGMAYGATSITMLLSAGLAPAVASGTVHLAEIGTCFASARRTGASATSTGEWSASWPCPARSGPSSAASCSARSLPSRPSP